jgi:hypothetical protein
MQCVTVVGSSSYAGIPANNIAFFDNAGSNRVNTSYSSYYGSWTHVCIDIQSGGTVTLFLDGVYKDQQTMTANISAVSAMSIAQTVCGSYDANCKIDEMRISIGTRPVTNSADPLYISSGTLTDGFTPPTAAYSEVAKTGFDNSAVLLSGQTPTAFDNSAVLLAGQTTTAFDNSAVILGGQTPTAFDNSAIILKGELVKTGFDNTAAILSGTLSTAFDNSAIQLRGNGSNSYYFDLRDANDAQVNTATGAPPTTVFTDLFTGLSDGSYTLYCRSQTSFRNMEDTIDITFVPFTLSSGLIIARVPNEVIGVTATATKGGNVLVEWNYSDTNQEIAPNSFEVYVDAVLDTSVTYDGAKAYSLSIGPLSETLKTIKVTAKAGTSETTGLTDTVTPDATAPGTVPFTFEVS